MSGRGSIHTLKDPSFFVSTTTLEIQFVAVVTRSNTLRNSNRSSSNFSLSFSCALCELQRWVGRARTWFSDTDWSLVVSCRPLVMFCACLLDDSTALHRSTHFLSVSFLSSSKHFRSALSRIPHTILSRTMRSRRSPKLQVAARRRTSAIYAVFVSVSSCCLVKKIEGLENFVYLTDEMVFQKLEHFCPLASDDFRPQTVETRPM